MIPCILAITTRIYPILNVQSSRLSNSATIRERLQVTHSIIRASLHACPTIPLSAHRPHQERATLIVMEDLVYTTHTATAQTSRFERDVISANCAQQPTYLIWPDMWREHVSPALTRAISGVPTGAKYRTSTPSEHRRAKSDWSGETQYSKYSSVHDRRKVPR